MRVLIMGLPGAGKTTLAKELFANLFPNCLWVNADIIREKYNDWDFSYEGRIRQAKRLREEADAPNHNISIVDFVCPLPEMRDIFDADFTIWVDTIAEGRFADTNKLFVPPEKYDVRVSTYDVDHWMPLILDQLLSAHKHLVVQELTHSNNDL